MATLEELEIEVGKLKERNSKVEQNKSWETSWTRRLVLTISTYIILSTYMWAVDIDRPFINAIVPTVGFMLSTMSLPIGKRIWKKFIK